MLHFKKQNGRLFPDTADPLCVRRSAGGCCNVVASAFIRTDTQEALFSVVELLKFTDAHAITFIAKSGHELKWVKSKETPMDSRSLVQ